MLEHADPDRSFVERILAATGTDLSRPRTNRALTEPLSDRELQMLSMLANGDSNREIGRALYISENTVKYHLKNIYSKLTVNSRTQAISVARQLRLVD